MRGKTIGNLVSLMKTPDDGPSLEADEAIASWVAAEIDQALGHPHPAAHIPFYRLAYYPDVLDLRRAGYELDAFAPLFDLLDEARVSHGQAAHRLLHLPTSEGGMFGDSSGGNHLWTPRRARELEFFVRAELHEFGLSEVTGVLRRTIGRAFPGDSLSHIAVDLLHIFFWAAIAQIARDYAWRSPGLEFAADYLEYPVRRAFGVMLVGGRGG